MKTEPVLLSLLDVRVQLDNRLLFDGFNLDVRHGEKILLQGRSGSGKSTLLKLLLGFVPPSKGTILVSGQSLDRSTISMIRRKIAYVSQGIDLGPGCVREIITSLLAYRSNRHLKLDRDELAELMVLLELDSGLLDTDISELSGGEKQRVAIMISLLLKRSIFLLDEITSALDAELKKTVVNHFLQIPNATILVVSHDTAWMEAQDIRVVKVNSK